MSKRSLDNLVALISDYLQNNSEVHSFLANHAFVITSSTPDP